MDIFWKYKRDHIAMIVIAFLVSLLIVVSTLVSKTNNVEQVTPIAFLVSAGIVKFYAMAKLLKHYSGIALILAGWVALSALFGTGLARLLLYCLKLN